MKPALARGGRAAAPWLLVVLLTGLFVVLGLYHAAHVNRDERRHDQSTYLHYAQFVHDTHFEGLGNRVQSPAYPTILALTLDDHDDEPARFVRAQRFGVLFSALIALCTAALLWRLLPRAAAVALSLVMAFTVYVFRAPYVQAENLSYLTLFVQYLAMLELWKKPRLGIAVLVGIALAAAWLTKGTALLGFWILGGALLVRGATTLRQGGWRGAWRTPLLYAVSFGTFFVLVLPYTSASKRIYGGYLYNLSSTYVMWCDSWDDWVAFEHRFGYHEGFKNLPPEVLPTMARYFATHSLGSVAQRTTLGLAEVLGNLLLTSGPQLFALAYGGFVLLLCRRHPDFRRAVFRAEPNAGVWFTLAYVGVYLLAFGFYGPIAAGARFSLGVYLPAMYALSLALVRHARPEHVWSQRAIDRDAFFRGMIWLALVSIVTYVPVAMATRYAGG